MKSRTSQNLQLGAFVVAGSVLLIITLYLLGSQRNLFSSVVRVSAHFRNVSGLMVGNNVRFGGITIGTVDKLTIRSDTVIEVVMMIEKSAQPFIKTSAIASIGTDGLMGNTIITITPVSGNASMVHDGDRLGTVQPVAVSELLNTLGQSNDNLVVITEELKGLGRKLNQSPVLDKLLTDESLVNHIDQTAQSVRKAGAEVHTAATGLRTIVGDIENGKGNAGYLLRDTSMKQQFTSVLSHINRTGQRADSLVAGLTTLTQQIQKGQGAAGTLLADTAFQHNLTRTMSNVQQGTAKFDENMEALKHNVLFRGYFKKQQKRRQTPSPVVSNL
ncbi:hypothetical protein GCM10023189_05450 [Nibrella saemangeumensis]|uniref:Mce/MlaD domain-containing protein n=1 Tax=Nibrella saemangeumensis TaxID=1084526 RepID=A0ABP8MEC5_9BACT